jgi:ATP-binding cassette, subfamily B, bacterial MsbA
MLDRILGKEIAAYVKKQRMLIAFALVFTIVSSLFGALQAILIEPFINEGMKSSASSGDATAPATTAREDKTSFKIDWLEIKKESGPAKELSSSTDTATPVKGANKKEQAIKIPGLGIIIKKTQRILIDNISSNRLLIILSIIAFISMIFKSISGYLGQLAAAAFSQRAIKAMRIDIFNKFITLNQGFYDKHKVGVLISRSTADLSVMQHRISTITIGLIQHPFNAFIFLILLFVKNWQLTLVIFLAAPLIVGSIRVFGRKAKKHSIRVQDAIAEVTSTYQEALLCLRVIQGFCIGQSQSERFRGLADELYKKSMRWSRWNLGLGPMMDTTVFFVLPATLILGKVYFHLTLGELGMIFFCFSRVYAPVRNLAQISNELRTLQGATQRVFGILSTDSEIREKPDAVVLQKHRGSLEFNGVSFAYDPSTPVLKDISFKVNVGETVAFVGSTGAGKSTILDLIPRFYDVTEGMILIDGKDIRDVTIESLRRQIGIVNQEVLLFHDTIANNISFNSPDVGMNEISGAARAAHAHDFIMAQPDQYETLVGDRGTLLSGGQKQRIAIARAILADSSILLLDEVASALDAESERIIQDAIDNLKGERTIFVVAHRLSTVRTADRIFVLEHGKIVESGTFDDLVEMDGRFRQLYDIQFKV